MIKARLLSMFLVICLLAMCLCGCRSATSDAEITTEAVVDDREVIEVAVDAMANTMPIHYAAIEFNQTNTEYRVEVTMYEDAEIWNTKLVAGDLPDVIFYGMADMWQPVIDASVLSKKGYLQDLYVFMGGESEYRTEDFVSNILVAAEDDSGALYQMPLSVGLNLVVGDADVLGELDGWTLDECIQFLETIGYKDYLFGPNISRSVVLVAQFLPYYTDSFLDWETGECSFDSEEFCKLLELIKEYAPSEQEWEPTEETELFETGRQLLYEKPIYAVNSVQEFTQIIGEPCFIGIPRSDGSGSAFMYEQSFSISSLSEHPDAAWDFVSILMQEDYQLDMAGFPVVSDVLETYLQSGEDITYILDGNITVGETTEEDRELTRRLINETDRMVQYDYALMQIVREEAEKYFQDLKTVEEASENIQNRVSLYMAEQG